MTTNVLILSMCSIHICCDFLPTCLQNFLVHLLHLLTCITNDSTVSKFAMISFNMSDHLSVCLVTIILALEAKRIQQLVIHMIFADHDNNELQRPHLSDRMIGLEFRKVMLMMSTTIF